MSECRSLTNFISNGVTALAVAHWEKVLNRGRLTRQLKAGPARVEDVLPA
jgi:aerobic C4-dicarboxylate transport protein